MKKFIAGVVLGTSLTLAMSAFVVTPHQEEVKDSIIDLEQVAKIETTDAGSLITLKDGNGYYFENYDYQK